MDTLRDKSELEALWNRESSMEKMEGLSSMDKKFWEREKSINNRI